MWLDQIKDGDAEAAHRLWQVYFDRLVRLAQRKLGAAPRRVADEEDVVAEAFNSFCAGARDGKFPRLDDRDDLWHVLVMLTARKAISQRRHQMRAKRGGGNLRGESIFALSPSERAGMDMMVGSEPSPSFAAQVVDCCDALFSKLPDETMRNIAIWKMQGQDNQEIAGRLDCRVRTVERKLKLIRSLWVQEDE